MIVASPGIIMVAITSINNTFFPLKSRKENENAAREQEMICPKVMSPATRNELITKRTSGTFCNACRKFSKVGCFGRIFRSRVKSSLDGMNAMLIAYKSGRRTINATTIFNAMCPVVLAALLYFCCASIFAFAS